MSPRLSTLTNVSELRTTLPLHVFREGLPTIHEADLGVALTATPAQTSPADVYRIIQARRYQAMKNIVLVHGGFVDGAGWEGVYKTLKGHGYKVSIVQNPTISSEDDVAVTKRILATQDGPTILVGHSYGGAVITEAGNQPKVPALVHIAAFAPDKGESVGSLIKDPPPGAPVPPILPRKTAFCSSTGRSFLLLSQPTWTRKKLRLWLTPKFRGAWGPLAARSANPRVGPSRAGTLSPPRTG